MGDTEYERLKAQLSEVLPKTGLVYSERGPLTEVLCKPKIMPLKSETLKKLEKMEKQILEAGNNVKDEDQQEAAEAMQGKSEAKEEEIYTNPNYSEEDQKKGEGKSRKWVFCVDIAEVK